MGLLPLPSAGDAVVTLGAADRTPLNIAVQMVKAARSDTAVAAWVSTLGSPVVLLRSVGDRWQTDTVRKLHGRLGAARAG
jgi:hypothetical protein